MAYTDNRQFTGVDVTKFIMAFAVIAIHVSSGSVVGIPFPEAMQWFNAIAVPFFFITSGYLLGRKLTEIRAIDLKRKYLSD